MSKHFYHTHAGYVLLMLLLPASIAISGEPSAKVKIKPNTVGRAVAPQEQWQDPDFAVIATGPRTIEIRLIDRSNLDERYEILGSDFFQEVVLTGSGQTVIYVNDDLEPGTHYAYSVDAFLKDGTMRQSVAAGSVTTPLAVPDFVPVRIPQEEGAIKIGFLSRNPISQNEIYRSLSPSSGFEHIATVAHHVGSFADDDVQPNTTYYYKMRAVNGDPDLTSSFSQTRGYRTHSQNYNPVLTATVGNANTIRLTLRDSEFNDEAYYISVLDGENATSVAGPLVMPDSGSSVTILHEDLQPGTTYTYTVTVFVNTYPDAHISNVATATATTSAPGTGYIDWEIWKDVPGNTVASIPLDEAPDRTVPMTWFETPQYYDDNYGSRIRGYIVPPQTGSYTFWISSDDHSELWLSKDDNPNNKEKIASVTGHTQYRQWTKYASQKSVQILLQAGQRYYIEALHKDALSADHVSVGWQLPDGTMERPILGTRLIKFESTAPQPCADTGGIGWEVWHNISGTEISAVPFHTAPDHTTTFTSFETGQYFANNYGSRMRGYICPPVTGSYVFWISSDDKSELWLSTDENPSNKIKIASVTGHTAFRQWDKYPLQVSEEIHLVAGRKYYVEALHKEVGGNDHISVGWDILASGISERPIPGNRLIPFESNDQAPEVTLTSPMDGGHEFGPAIIEIRAEATDPDGTITKVEFYNGTTKLAEDPNAPYSFNWENVPQGTYDISAKAIDNQGNFATATAQVRVIEGFGHIQREVWRDITGSAVTSIPVDQEADEVVDLENFFETQTYYANNYGSRIRGFINPPTTGNYRFWIAGDDYCELWLSTNHDPANKIRIAHVPGYTQPGQWDKYPGQQSALVSLQGGNVYYIEALQKEASGNDHVAVGWQLPDGTMERPIFANRLTPFHESPGPAALAETESDAMQIDLYPNPLPGRVLTLSFPKSQAIEGRIEVISFSGRVVHSEEVACPNECVDVLLTLNEDVAPGLYLVKITSGDVQWSRRLVVR